MPVRLLALGLAATILLFSPRPISANSLMPQTLQTWTEYVKNLEAQNEQRLASGRSFLWSDEVPGQADKLRSGELVISPAANHVPLSIPSGLIHDWLGAAFIPGVTLDNLLSNVRDYLHYKDFYCPNIVRSEPLTTSESTDLFSLLLVNKSVFVTAALDGDYRSFYTCLDDLRCYSINSSTRIQEVADYETTSQHLLPENEGSGYMWRQFSITRYEQRDGGVYVEMEMVVLSRDIPLAIRWLADPFVRRLSRSAMETSLIKTQAAARATLNGVESGSWKWPSCK